MSEYKFITNNGLVSESEVKEALPHKYPMELNKTDMLMLLKALHDYSSGDENAELLMNDILLTIGLVE